MAIINFFCRHCALNLNTQNKTKRILKKTNNVQQLTSIKALFLLIVCSLINIPTYSTNHFYTVVSLE